MKIAALMPTYGRPRLVANALACFLAQDYPAENRRPLILDDAGQIAPQSGADWEVWSTGKKFPSLPAKYKFLVDRANEWSADAYSVWDDDDIYLPWHLPSHAQALANAGWSHPSKAWSLYTGSLALESATGRFHGALAVRRDFAERVGYWDNSTRCDYDQQIMGRLFLLSPPGRPDLDNPPSYVYRWGSTHADHCSGRCRGPDDATWYTQTPITEAGQVGHLTPRMDAETKAIYRHFAGQHAVNTMAPTYFATAAFTLSPEGPDASTANMASSAICARPLSSHGRELHCTRW
jgi:hypothetical protein